LPEAGDAVLQALRALDEFAARRPVVHEERALAHATHGLPEPLHARFVALTGLLPLGLRPSIAVLGPPLLSARIVLSLPRLGSLPAVVPVPPVLPAILVGPARRSLRMLRPLAVLRVPLLLRPLPPVRPVMARAARVVPLPIGVARRLSVRLRRARVSLPARMLRAVLLRLSLVGGPAAAAAPAPSALLRGGGLPRLRRVARGTAVCLSALHAPRRQVRDLLRRAAARLLLGAF